MSELPTPQQLTVSVIGFVRGPTTDLGAASYQLAVDAPGLEHGVNHAAILAWLQIHAARDLRQMLDFLVTNRTGQELVPWSRPSSPRLFLELLGLDG